MTSSAKVAANRRNARKSTGPRTPGGKALARLNALRHGVLSRMPVVTGEDAADWERRRDGVRASVGAAGTLEVALADRAALILWRLDRLARADAVGTSADVTEALLAGPPGGCGGGEAGRGGVHAAHAGVGAAGRGRVVRTTAEHPFYAEREGCTAASYNPVHLPAA